MAAAGLKTSIWNNNLRSLLLLATYPFLIAALAGAVVFIAGYALAWPASGMAASAAGDASLAMRAGFAMSKDFLAQWWPGIFAFVIAWFMIAYFLQGRMVRALSHAHPVSREEEPELYNLLENLCISRGMKMPRLEIIETHARNAFASGIDENSYSITVTRGLLQSMQKDEVEAVLGHELTHIINRDVRLLIVSIIFTGMIGFFAQMAWSSIRYSSLSRRRGGGQRGDGRIVLIMFAVAIILWIGYAATMLTRFALSRRREFMADAGSVELTKNPEAMMRALLRLSGKDRIPEATADIALMCIENSSRFFGIFATHPPLAERIEAIAQLTGTPVPSLPQEDQFGAPDAGLAAERGAQVNPWADKSNN